MKMYYIAVVAPEKINEDVLKWKHYMRDHHGCKVALRSPAHITLIPPFWMDESLESDLAAVTGKAISGTGHFDIHLQGFGSFPPRVIYINVEPNESLSILKQRIEDTLVKSDKFKIEKELRPYHPHLTIATRDLHKAAYKEAMAVFSKKKYIASWTVSSVAILRHDREKWETWKTLEFGMFDF